MDKRPPRIQRRTHNSIQMTHTGPPRPVFLCLQDPPGGFSFCPGNHPPRRVSGLSRPPDLPGSPAAHTNREGHAARGHRRPAETLCLFLVFVPTTHIKRATGGLLCPLGTLRAKYYRKRPGMAYFLHIFLPISGKLGESWEVFKKRQKLVNNLFSFLECPRCETQENLKSPESRESRVKNL